MRRKELRIVLEIAVILIAIIGVFLINEQITDNRIKSFFPDTDNFNYAYEVEKVYTDENDLVIEGWIFELRKVNNVEREVEIDKKPAVLLYDTASVEEKDMDGIDKAQKGIPAEVSTTKRSDVNSYFACEYDYSKCGFVARIKKSSIDYDNGKYQIVLKCDEKSEYGMPAAWLINGKLSYIDSDDEMRLEVAGTDLEKIVSDGICVASFPAFHICIYQYDWKLYYIADEGYAFKEDGKTYLEYQMNTTQFSRLPQERIDTGYFWGNMGGEFEAYEATSSMNCGKYRVCVRDIPIDFSVYRIWTGYYVEDWIWGASFRPVIQLSK